jgi:death on curing protein
VTVWVIHTVVLAIHDEQIAEHGGTPGVRDMGLLESALNRPVNLEAYGDPTPDISDLAAAYAFGIAKNHAFFDGNKRVSLVVTRLFLHLNGHDIDAPEVERLHLWRALGEGSLQEAAFAEWIRNHLVVL